MTHPPHHPDPCAACHGTGKVESPPGHFMGGVVYRCGECEKAGRPVPYTVARTLRAGSREG